MSARGEDVERRIANLRAVARHEARRARGDGAPQGREEKPRSGMAKKLALLGPIGIALAFVLGKLKLIVPLLKFAKVGTLASMFVAVWAYALLWGFPFALGFVLLILVHELGHAIVMRRLGIDAGAPVFIPFVGAVIAMRGMPRNAYVEALVGIGGPVLGSLGALVCLVVGALTGSPFWYALASTGFLINLFNLIPISPLDGGRIVGVIGRWLWIVGYVIGIAVFLATRSPLLFLVLLVGLFSLARTVRGPRPGYFDVEPSKRIGIGAAYFGLVAALAVGMAAAQGPLRGIGPG